ncbi:MAG: hypothetical protein Q9163_002091 [Psora crenata]
MTDLPQPSFTFTIPSIHGGAELDCRIYNPPNPAFSLDNSPAIRGGLGGAIVAHPYAPLGGCYDDSVVLSLVEKLLKQKLVVGTFNFRGAGTSKGSTSWTAKAELNDYISFAGLFIHYLHNIRTHLSSTPGLQCSSNAPCPISVILGGYSYGSLVATHLPPTTQILSPFSHPATGTAAAEIRLRAHHLSSSWLVDLQLHKGAKTQASRPPSPSGTLYPVTIKIGGDESARRSRQLSREGNGRSIDNSIKRSMERSRRRFGLPQRSCSSGGGHGETAMREDAQRNMLHPVNIHDLRTAYLLVSPLLPPLSSLLTLSAGQRRGRAWEGRLAEMQTLVVFGNRDMFTDQRKLRRWVEGLKEGAGPSFRFSEVPGAGHFWKEEGVEERLKAVVGEWAEEIILGSLYDANGGLDMR